MSASLPEPALRRADRLPPSAHLLAQNIGLALAIGMLVACIIAYCAVFFAQQGMLPRP